jgi:transposase-like protein
VYKCAARGVKKAALFQCANEIAIATYLALQNITKKWTLPVRDWLAALNRFAIMFEDRMPLR